METEAAMSSFSHIEVELPQVEEEGYYID